MRLIIIGCEYTGKTTLAQGLKRHIMDRMGDQLVMVHDHFLPDIGEGAPGRFTLEEEEDAFFSLPPFALEKYTRYMNHYHLGQHFYRDNDHLVVNWFYGDAVYAPLYFGFGGQGEYADRHALARHEESHIMEVAPDTVLIHLTAAPETIRQRMAAAPRPRSRFRAGDIETVRDRFAGEFTSAVLRRKVALDTTNSTPDETLEECLRQLEPHFTTTDRLRLLTHAALARDHAAAGSTRTDGAAASTRREPPR